MQLRGVAYGSWGLVWQVRVGSWCVMAGCGNTALYCWVLPIVQNIKVDYYCLEFGSIKVFCIRT